MAENLPNLVANTISRSTKPGIVVHTYNISTLEGEARGPQVGGQPRIQSKMMSQINKIFKRRLIHLEQGKFKEMYT
jgi:hypothetical protein